MQAGGISGSKVLPTDRPLAAGCRSQRARPRQATLHSFLPGVCRRGSGDLFLFPSERVWCFRLPLRPCLGRRRGCGVWGRLLLLRRTSCRGYYFQQGQRVRLLPRAEVWDRVSCVPPPPPATQLVSGLVGIDIPGVRERGPDDRNHSLGLP